MHIPKIQIHSSPEFEQLRISSTFENIDWYRNNGYEPIFPGNKSVADIQSDTKLSDLLSLVNTEYDEDYFKNAKTELILQWQWFAEHWLQSPIQKIKLEFNGEYNIYFTSYGVGGSYELPNNIVINIKKRGVNHLANIVFHEMIHLSIEPLIQKYEIPHWYKERLVDLYYKYSFPEKSFEQNLPHEVLAVDSFFKEYYSDADKLIQSLRLSLK